MNPRNLTRGLAAGTGSSLPPLAASEETLVADVRSGLTLAQMIESRFASLLWDVGLHVPPRRKFHPGVVGQIAHGVTRFEISGPPHPSNGAPACLPSRRPAVVMFTAAASTESKTLERSHPWAFFF